MKRAVFEIPKNRHGGVYMIYNVNNHRVYIGETHDFAERATQHKYHLLGNRHPNKQLQIDFNAGNDFVFVILEDMGASCNDRDLGIREKQYMFAFLWKYVKLYNHQISLFQDLILCWYLLWMLHFFQQLQCLLSLTYQ